MGPADQSVEAVFLRRAAFVGAQGVAEAGGEAVGFGEQIALLVFQFESTGALVWREFGGIAELVEFAGARGVVAFIDDFDDEAAQCLTPAVAFQKT